MKQNLIRANPISDVVLCKPDVKDSEDSGVKKGKALREEIREDVLTWVMENPLLKPIIITFTLTGLRSLLNRFIKTHSLEAEKITLYTFRHTFATILLEKRENPKIVAELVGHAKISTTLDLYSHVLSNTVYEKTAQTLDGVFKKINSGQLLSNGINI